MELFSLHNKYKIKKGIIKNMIWAILIPLLALSIFLTVKAVRSYDEPVGFIIGSVFSWIGTAVAIICLCILITEYLGFGVIDQKISILEEENSKIENQIEETVKQFQDYESGIFTDSTQDVDSDVLVLVERYPEIKSDTLVQQQIDLYTKNNKEIKEFKLSKINKYKYELWLFFDLRV